MTKQTRIQRHLDNLSNLAQENVLHYEDGTEYNIYDLKDLMAKELVAIEKIQEEQENTEISETTLTVKELQNMGKVLADIGETIELYNHAMNFTPDINDIRVDGIAARYRALYDLTSTMFRKNQGIMKELDHIGHTLSENDNAFEIENTRKRFN